MLVLHQKLNPQAAEESNMVARPLMPQQVQPAPPVQHAQFRQAPPSMLDTAKSALAGQVINKGATAATNYMFPAAAVAAPAAAGTAGALGAAAAPAAASALGAGAGAAGAATAGGLGGALGGLGAGLGGAGAGLMAAAAPVALPLAIGAGLGKLFGLFNEGGLVPSETMTAVGQQAPQQNGAAPQTGGPLSFKHAEQQQKLALKQATFDADQKRKDEAHRMKMMQQQLKLTEAVSGFQTPLSAR